MKMASRSELLPVHLNYFLPSNLNIEFQSTGLGFWIWKITARGKPRDTVFCSELVTCRPCGRWHSTAKKIMNMEVWKQKRLLFRKKKWLSFQGVDQWRRLQIQTSMNLSLTWQTSSWHNLEVSRLSQSWLASDRMLVCNLMVSHYPIACLFIKHVFLLKSFD